MAGWGSVKPPASGNSVSQRTAHTHTRIELVYAANKFAEGLCSMHGVANVTDLLDMDNCTRNSYVLESSAYQHALSLTLGATLPVLLRLNGRLPAAVVIVSLTFLDRSTGRTIQNVSGGTTDERASNCTMCWNLDAGSEREACFHMLMLARHKGDSAHRQDSTRWTGRGPTGGGSLPLCDCVSSRGSGVKTERSGRCHGVDRPSASCALCCCGVWKRCAQPAEK